MLMLFRYPEY